MVSSPGPGPDHQGSERENRVCVDVSGPKNRVKRDGGGTQGPLWESDPLWGLGLVPWNTRMMIDPASPGLATE